MPELLLVLGHTISSSVHKHLTVNSVFMSLSKNCAVCKKMCFVQHAACSAQVQIVRRVQTVQPAAINLNLTLRAFSFLRLNHSS